ncbi:4'-phosphopantetheinyl transferase [Streptomyces sp. NBC_00083]|uniref:4'-phosphopantetheinyl transferase family protein n=1 Tax=Streptomyces sp. NBC_00083 TaxID=2975647 RepID=UPI002258EC4D|nr:4'-phosphopantetheinyl transferase superfamily protein [Streptomyces sp. NBC_00083]MCX5387496.1 4'-phosphopantetheinyl transferase superfamily protein [Streptomyces sp. NBC_00083]
MIEQLLTAPMAVAEAFHDDVVEGVGPYEAEERLVADAVPRRRREFTTVRVLARQALAELRIAPSPILPGPLGAPVWPGGVVGSMTHCAGYRAAAVAYGGDFAAIGIDAEPHLPIEGIGTLDLVTVPQERAWLAALRVRRPEVCWDRLVFSAKESVYKAWFPLTGRRLDFDEAVVTVDPDLGTFHARLLVDGPEVGGRRIRGFDGGWLHRDGILLTAVALTRGAANAVRAPGVVGSVSGHPRPATRSASAR